jgi:hypothetical protein
MADNMEGRVRRLAEALRAEGIAEDVAAQIMAGGEAIRGSSSREAKATWLAAAMERMDALLDAPTRQAVRVRCACCLGGKRQQVSRGIAQNASTLEERVSAANEARFVFGRSVSRTEDGGFLVCFQPDDLPAYSCPCLPVPAEPMSATYCYCCGGHVRHHLQNALRCKLNVTVRTSALSSAGREPCRFVLHPVEA